MGVEIPKRNMFPETLNISVFLYLPLWYLLTFLFSLKAFLLVLFHRISVGERNSPYRILWVAGPGFWSTNPVLLAPLWIIFIILFHLKNINSLAEIYMTLMGLDSLNIDHFCNQQPFAALPQHPFLDKQLINQVT